MPQMARQDVEQVWHKVNSEENLSGPIQEPVQEFNQWHQSVRLKHVVAVLSQGAELLDDSNDETQTSTEVLYLLPLAHRDPLTHVDECWHELQFAH